MPLWRVRLSHIVAICGNARSRRIRWPSENPPRNDLIAMSSMKSLPPADRVSALKLRQTLKMARSAHAYVRGSTIQFYQWLENSKGKVPEGPALWICGDCHAGNLGPVASADGRVAIQIRDFDQTVIGNPAHDIIRLALSLA